MAEKTAEGKRKRFWQRGSGADETVEGAEQSLATRKGRATPSRRQKTEATTSGSILVRIPGAFRNYVEGVYAEVKKVTWPTRQENLRLTAIVVVATTIASIFLGGLSLGYAELFRVGLDNPIVLGVALAIVVALGAGYIVYNNRQSGDF